jgi:hypothetical protein
VEENSGREEVKKVQKNFQLMVRFENKKDMTTTKELLNNLLAEDGGVNMNGTMVKRALEAYILEN